MVNMTYRKDNGFPGLEIKRFSGKQQHNVLAVFWGAQIRNFPKLKGMFILHACLSSNIPNETAAKIQ